MIDYVLVLVPLHKDFRDISGNLFDKKGIVKSDNFKPDTDITSGICGIEWGYGTPYYQCGFSNNFAVVKVTESIIKLTMTFNLVKFCSGYVVKAGTFKECSEIIRKDKNLPLSLQKKVDYFIDVDESETELTTWRKNKSQEIKQRRKLNGPESNEARIDGNGNDGIAN